MHSGVKVRIHARNHAYRSSLLALNLHIALSMKLKFPPLLVTDSEDASGREGQGDVGGCRYTKCNPHPDIFSSIAFYVVTRPVADPAPELS